MKVTIEELERCQILMTIEVEPAQEKDLLKKAAQRISRKARIPGFRPGKAPFNTVVRRLGMEVIQQELLEHSGEKIVADALKEAELKPLAPVKFDEISWDPLTIKVRVPGPPQIELDEYRDIRLEAKTVEVSDDDVDQELKALHERSATWAPVERPAEVGDLVTMSVVQKDGDEVVVENDAVEYELTPPSEDDEDQPDFTTPLLGLSAGDEKTFTIDYPENLSNERLAGKEINIEVKVSSVKAKELDPLDDDFAQSVSDVETLAELKDKLRTNIEQRRESQYNYELGREAFGQIIASAKKIEWPEAFEEYYIDQEFERHEKELGQSGLTLDNYLSMQKKTKESLREEIRAAVVKNLRTAFVLNKVAELEGLEVSNVEILDRAKLIADLSGGGDRVWQGVLASESQHATIANDLLSGKVFNRLAAIAKGEAPEPGEEVEASEAANDEPQTTPDEAQNEAQNEAQTEGETTESVTEKA